MLGTRASEDIGFDGRPPCCALSSLRWLARDYADTFDSTTERLGCFAMRGMAAGFIWRSLHSDLQELLMY